MPSSRLCSRASSAPAIISARIAPSARSRPIGPDEDRTVLRRTTETNLEPILLVHEGTDRLAGHIAPEDEDGTSLADVKEVRSHPMALPQCRDWLNANRYSISA